MRIVINGAGIAGTSLAYWLRRHGHDVALVEQSPQLRTGGYAIDFWGVGYDITEKMGLLPRINDVGFRIKAIRYVNRHGRTTGGFSIDVFRRLTNDRFIEIQRSGLAEIIYDALSDDVETIFGDSITGIHDTGQSVHVTFGHTPPREADLVVGADGLHSQVRSLVFGPEADFEVPLGYHVGAFVMEDNRSGEELVAINHGAPGRQVSLISLPGNEALVLFVFRDKYLTIAKPADDQQRRQALADAFADVGWQVPQILAAMQDVDAIYFDSVSQIRMDHWTKGRTALVGDAAACVSLLAGEGTGLAIAESYVLAGELEQCRSDYTAAFANYEKRLMPFLQKKQRFAEKFASSFAPRTTPGLMFRDAVTALLRVPPLAKLILGSSVLDDMELPQYD